MKVSELTLDIIKQYLRIDGNNDDILLEMLRTSSIQYCTSYMGCTIEDLDKYNDVTIVVLSLISDSYEVRQFTTSTITLNPIMQGVLDLHCSNFIGSDITSNDNITNNMTQISKVAVYDVVWGIAQPGAPGKVSRGYLQYNPSTGIGKLHLDMTVPSSVANGNVICKLPNDAPVPINLLEVQANANGGSIYVEPNKRDIQCWSLGGITKRYIVDLVGFWKDIK